MDFCIDLSFDIVFNGGLHLGDFILHRFPQLSHLSIHSGFHTCEFCGEVRNFVRGGGGGGGSATAATADDNDGRGGEKKQ